ncbi:MAG: hypothetical protein HYV09_28265 [Deltaproteobacteria bacterium]|nr:hypothetical protein [Deltaproteobacteria bacterium]
MARELALLQAHNRAFRPGDSQATYLLISEAAMVLMTLERWLRIILRTDATDDDTLPTLLEAATSDRLRLLVLPYGGRQEAIDSIGRIRNSILHSNFEQAAVQARLPHHRDWFREQLAGEVEQLGRLLDHFIEQIDSQTGLPHARLRFVTAREPVPIPWVTTGTELYGLVTSRECRAYLRSLVVALLETRMPSRAWRRLPEFLGL